MPTVKDEEKDDGSRAAGEGLSPPLSFRCPSSSCNFPYRGPLPIFPRTQHVVPAFIIIVIIILVDGPLMNRWRRLSGWERYEKNGERVGEERYDPAEERERERKNSKKQKMDRAERIRWWRRGRKSGYRAKEEPRGKKRASIVGFVVGLLVICSFDIIASELFGGAWIYVPSWLPIRR